MMSIKCLRAQCRTFSARSAEQPSQLCSAISVGDDLKIGYRDADVQLHLSPGPAGVMRGAATTEPEIAALLQSLLSARRENLGMFVQGLVQNGPLRAGLSVDEATDTVWTLTSAEVYHLLTVGRGWSRE